MEGSTYNLQQPCTQMGTSAKREKNHFTGTQPQIACLPSTFTPLTQVVFDYPPLEFDLTPPPPIPILFLKVSFFFLSTS